MCSVSFQVSWLPCFPSCLMAGSSLKCLTCVWLCQHIRCVLKHTTSFALCQIVCYPLILCDSKGSSSFLVFDFQWYFLMQLYLLMKDGSWCGAIWGIRDHQLSLLSYPSMYRNSSGSNEFKVKGKYTNPHLSLSNYFSSHVTDPLLFFTSLSFGELLSTEPSLQSPFDISCLK